MRHLALIFGSILFVIMAQSPTLAIDTDKVTIKNSFENGEVREYKVDVTIKGNFPNPETKQPMDIDTAMSFKIRHRYTRRDKDGLAPLEISLREGEVTIDGQKISITPSLYPKLTALLDIDFVISNIIGIELPKPGALPGINYNNMLMLFYLPGPTQGRALGETWDFKVMFPALKEAYNFKNTLKSLETVNGAKAAMVKQEINRVPMPASTDPIPQLKATAQSAFAPSNGKLLKSHIDCEVALIASSAGESSPKSNRASIKMDISLLK